MTEQKPNRASRVLIVDGNTATREAAAKVLEGAGFAVDQAPDAIAAAKVLAREQAPIVLISADMPENGFRFCERLRKEHGSALYLILRTGKEQLFSKDFSADEGADDFLIEPSSDNELLARVETGRKMKQLQYKLDETSESLQKFEETDRLTGAYNQVRIEKEIDREIDRVRRYGRPLCIVVLDIDDFRVINEKYGRAAGDRALAEVGRILRLSTRGTDSVGRHGAEEFMIVLPETDAEQGVAAADKLRKLIHQTGIATSGTTINLTTSAGVATMQGDNYNSRSDLVAAAYGALEKAKASGKNRTEFAGKKG